MTRIEPVEPNLKNQADAGKDRPEGLPMSDKDFKKYIKNNPNKVGQEEAPTRPKQRELSPSPFRKNPSKHEIKEKLLSEVESKEFSSVTELKTDVELPSNLEADSAQETSSGMKFLVLTDEQAKNLSALKASDFGKTKNADNKNLEEGDITNVESLSKDDLLNRLEKAISEGKFEDFDFFTPEAPKGPIYLELTPEQAKLLHSLNATDVGKIRTADPKKVQELKDILNQSIVKIAEFKKNESPPPLSSIREQLENALQESGFTEGAAKLASRGVTLRPVYIELSPEQAKALQSLNVDDVGNRRNKSPKELEKLLQQLDSRTAVVTHSAETKAPNLKTEKISGEIQSETQGMGLKKTSEGQRPFQEEFATSKPRAQPGRLEKEFQSSPLQAATEGKTALDRPASVKSKSESLIQEKNSQAPTFKSLETPAAFEQRSPLTRGKEKQSSVASDQFGQQISQIEGAKSTGGGGAVVGEGSSKIASMDRRGKLETFPPEAIAGRPAVEGTPLEGKAPEGRVEGRPTIEGKTAEGRTVEGRPIVEGKTLEGRPIIEGKAEARPTIEGKTVEGRPIVEGKPIQGRSAEGRPTIESTRQGILESRGVEGYKGETRAIEGRPYERPDVQGRFAPRPGKPALGQPIESRGMEGKPLEGRPIGSKIGEKQGIEGRPVGQTQESPTTQTTPSNITDRPIERSAEVIIARATTGSPAQSRTAETQPLETNTEAGTEGIPGEAKQIEGTRRETRQGEKSPDVTDITDRRTQGTTGRTPLQGELGESSVEGVDAASEVLGANIRTETTGSKQPTIGAGAKSPVGAPTDSPETIRTEVAGAPEQAEIESTKGPETRRAEEPKRSRSGIPSEDDVTPEAEAAAAASTVTQPAQINAPLKTEQAEAKPVSREEMARMIEELANEIKVKISNGQTDIKVTLSSPKFLEGASVTIITYGHAKGEANIVFSGLSPDAKKILDDRLVKDSLTANLKDRTDIVVHNVITTTQAEPPVFTQTERQKREDSGQERGGGQGKQQQGDKNR